MNKEILEIKIKRFFYFLMALFQVIIVVGAKVLLLKYGLQFIFPVVVPWYAALMIIVGLSSGGSKN